MRMITSGLSDTGRVRAGNEDAFLLAPPLLIVADGMGGAAAGEVASSLAVKSIAAVFENRPASSVREAEERLRDAINGADTLLRKAVAQNPALTGMGTTAVATVLVDNQIVIGYVGDSRAYVVSPGGDSPDAGQRGGIDNSAGTTIRKQPPVHAPGTITRITDDHSVVMEMVRAGVITENDIRSHPFRNRITRCVGCTEEHTPDIRSITVRPGNILILCSDGLWEMVHEDLILAIAASASGTGDMCRRLVDAANDAGGQDNITVVAAMFE